MPNLPTLNFVDINYWAVLAATVLSMVLGFAWYSHAMFGKRWMELTGLTKEKQSMKGTLVTLFVTTFITAYVLALLINTLAFFPDWKDGVLMGFAVWFGFLATASFGMVLWEKRPLELYFLKNGHHLLSLIVMGALLASWR